MDFFLLLYYNEKKKGESSMIITLTDQNTRTTASIDSVGAQLISLKDASGKEYIWQRDPDMWSGSSPLLFPAIGNCRGGRTRFDGIWYNMKKHGFCREADFAVTDQTEASVTFRLASDEGTRLFYPYEFVLSLAYRLESGTLFMDYSVENKDSRRICYCLGAHPGFNCPLEKGESFEDYQLEFEKEENTHSVVYDVKALHFDPNRRGITLDHSRVLPLSYDLFREDAIYFHELLSRKVSLIHHRTRRGVQVAYPGFETVAFWTPDGKQAPFLCVEPWNGSAIWADEDDEFIHRRHVQILEPGRTKSYHVEIKILNAPV